MQQRHLALIYAQMGYSEASREEAGRIPAVSVRMVSEILSRLTSGNLEAERGDLKRAAARLPEVEDLLHRGVGCGALADPWNVLGFQGLFPLSPAREDSMPDPRLGELVQVVEQTFNLYARLSSEAAAVGDEGLARSLTDGLERLGAWWDPFATVEVGDVRRVHGGEAAASARQVTAALAGWRQRGEAAADLAFWRGQMDQFRSPKAFSLVVDALLRKGDFRAALALLVSWVGQAEQVPLEDGAYSFHALALRWMLALTQPAGEADGASLPPPDERRALVVRFFDYLEANAEEFWEVPALDVVESEAEDEEEEDLYGAAYEDVTYEDSTDDSEGAVSDGGPAEEFDLEREGERLDRRLRFQTTLARLWQVAARLSGSEGGADAPAAGWLRAARDKRRRMLRLLDAVHAQPLPDPGGAYEALVEYDRRRVLKDQILYATIGAALHLTLAVGALRGMVGDSLRESPDDADEPAPPWEPAALLLEKALVHGEPVEAREALPSFTEGFRREMLEILPLAEGGAPRPVLRLRAAQTVLLALLANLPRLGLLRETFELLRAARAVEQAQPTRGRGLREFNQFFQAAFQTVVEAVVESAAGWPEEQRGDRELVAVLERLTGPFLALWAEFSRTTPLSVLETLPSEGEWQALQEFVKKYGGELFHARFMTLANLRGVLHRGAGAYLDHLRDNPDPLRPVKLLDALGRSVRREDAVRRLEIVLHAVVENYEEFKDYNTTTAQSDYGENLNILLEFLRLKAVYERHAWQMRPLILAHEVLARCGRDAAAVRWEQTLAQFTRERADRLLEELARLERAHGVRLGTVADRLGERFTRPLALDRLCALVEPAMAEARGENGRTAFARLRKEVETFTATPAGVGLDVPTWLRRLEMEVQRVQAARTTIAALAEGFFRIPRRPLSYEELQRQLREWERPALPQ